MRVITAWVFLEPDARRLDVEGLAQTLCHALGVVVARADKRVVKAVFRLDDIGVRRDSLLGHERGNHAVSASVSRRHSTGHTAVIGRQSAGKVFGDAQCQSGLRYIQLEKLGACRSRADGTVPGLVI